MRYADDDDDDPEYPDAADTDDGDGNDGDENDVLDPCPNCRRLLYGDAERCPHCGEYVTPAAAGGHAKWVVVTAAVCLVVMVVYLFR